MALFRPIAHDPAVVEALHTARAQLDMVKAAAHGDPKTMIRIGEVEDVEVHLALRRLTVEVAHLHNAVAALLEVVERREQS